jgi:ring-1,2-phenylacetyl-CoA epoxidase subunit PaaD
VSVRTAAPPERASASAKQRVWQLLGTVPDPEIPVLSIVDLGIVRRVAFDAAGRLEVVLTPTYAACPATDVIRASVRTALTAGGYADAHIAEQLAPPWSSDWLSEAGRRKLKAFGIAPPQQAVTTLRRLWQTAPVRCPRCASEHTQRVSEFGSTPCKAHYRCESCAEPFDYFKCL